MARPKGFDVDLAVQSAMRLFRARGYEATSLKQLEGATGLKPGSLYNCFGSKEALFLAAIRHYNATVVQRRIDTYLQGKEPLAELRALFVSTLNEPGGTSFGCLLTNTAVEFSGVAPAVSAAVGAGFALLERAFARQIAQARARGLMPKTRPVKRIALQLLHAYQGLLVLVRFGRDRRDLTRLIDDLMTTTLMEAGND